MDIHLFLNTSSSLGANFFWAIPIEWPDEEEGGQNR